uniref:Peptide-methionine (R)-S-oxide reductase n=1 Tax=Octactis speculum TaxID=3111310 RepID=A0A7S2F7J2_9STRA
MAFIPLRLPNVILKHQRRGTPSVMAVVDKSEEEWQSVLTEMQYYVLREAGTEPAGSSELNSIKDNGTFLCAGCGSPLFTADTKFDSGTGWPSFFSPIDGDSVFLSTDYKLIIPRTEVQCGACKGHLGHVFEDGPKPSGQRYCLNGVAMQFQPDDADLELAAAVAARRKESPTQPRSPLAAVIPSLVFNAGIAGLFLNSFLSRDHTWQVGTTPGSLLVSAFEYFPVFCAIFYASLFFRGIGRLWS